MSLITDDYSLDGFSLGLGFFMIILGILAPFRIFSLIKGSWAL